jgi:23S rRNA (cytosine1962-C5)-methyltransferase
VFARGRDPVLWNSATACRLVDQALNLRRVVGALPENPGTMGWRLVHAEADFLPGLVLDVLGPVLVAQVNTAAAELVADEVVRHAARRLGTISQILVRRDSPAREGEGLPVLTEVERIAVPDSQVPSPLGADGPWPVVLDGGSVLLADGVGGQKTGLFLDQRLNRQLVAPLARGTRVLDMHCHVGGWSLALLRAGARSAHGVDSSARAVELARASAALKANEPYGSQATFEQGDDLEWLRRAAQRGDRYDLIVLDPPALAKAARHVPGALRMHGSLARHALRLLSPGGVLVQACCSQAIRMEQLEDAILQAAAREGVALHLLHRLSQPPDHPILAGHPASEYLKGVVLRRS